MFKSNVHTIERTARVILGVGLLGAAVAGSIGAWGYIGVIPLVTGVAGTCPLYTALGWSTCSVNTARN